MLEKISRRVRAADYLTVAELFLQDNFLLKKPLSFSDIKPRLLGHWGTCHGINLAYANLRAVYEYRPGFQFILGPGHGFPALQANLFLDGELEKVDKKAVRNLSGIEYLCKHFSWPEGFPSHASPFTPGVVVEGGELGYALGAAYGICLGHPDKTVAVLIGDGEFETATTMASMNLNKLITGDKNGKVLPILSLNGYKISGPTIAGRKSEREMNELIRGFGFTPLVFDGENSDEFQFALERAELEKSPFLIMKTKKGSTGPTEADGKRIEDNYLAHQIPLPLAKTDKNQLALLENWLKSYEFDELYTDEEGFQL